MDALQSFGLSQKKKVGATGTPLWMAPELLRGESGNTAASDVYSFGMILYEVYSREDPYKGDDHWEVLKLICDKKVNKRPPIPKGMPPAAASLMSDCLLADPESRPTCTELDNRLRRLDVANVEPGNAVVSHKERKSSQLLLEVFPAHIAAALREGRKVEPEHHDCVSVFFSDIVGFTRITASLSMLKVSDMLDRLYLAFDELSRKHDVFKIETIGKCYELSCGRCLSTIFYLSVKRPAPFKSMAFKCLTSLSVVSFFCYRRCLGWRYKPLKRPS